MTPGVYFGWHSHVWEDLLGLARRAEELGYAAFFHDGDISMLEQRPDAECLDGWTATVALLATTRRIPIGSIRLVHHWNAARLAQAAASAARIAPGRFGFAALAPQLSCTAANPGELVVVELRSLQQRFGVPEAVDHPIGCAGPEARQRVDQPDVVFTNKEAKYRAVANEIEAVHGTGRPVLVGTVSVAESEHLAAQLRHAGIDCHVLNAKNDQEEAAIVACAIVVLRWKSRLEGLEEPES